jgi:hypothetical protein
VGYPASIMFGLRPVQVLASFPDTSRRHTSPFGGFRLLHPSTFLTSSLSALPYLTKSAKSAIRLYSAVEADHHHALSRTGIKRPAGLTGPGLLTYPNVPKVPKLHQSQNPKPRRKHLEFLHSRLSYYEQQCQIAKNTINVLASVNGKVKTFKIGRRRAAFDPGVLPISY